MVGHQEIEILEKFFSIFSFATIDRFQQNQAPATTSQLYGPVRLAEHPDDPVGGCASLKHSRDYVTLRASAGPTPRTNMQPATNPVESAKREANQQ
jgi:hypothetical protein